MELDIEGYARVMAEMFAAGDGRAEVLTRNGLDEATWERADALWQGRLSAALDEPGDGVAPLISAYSVAYEAAQRALGPPLSLERFAEVTRRLKLGADLQAALGKAGVTLQAYVRGCEHWSPRIARESEVSARFLALLRAG